ncbi:hypothetical protein FO519_008974 [Halicephalobus sp. NKZ332]|nr:hypothetical protein FO519_008974 [Halicephalobus sp. NKZ332]
MKIDLDSVVDYVPEILPNISLDVAVEEAVDYAHCHGMVLRLRESRDKSDICQVAPLTLFPSPFPRKLFHEALDVQNDMSYLYFRLSWDHDFLVEAHKEVIRTDDFIRKLMEIYEEVWKSKTFQKKTLVLQRADYMCDVSRDPEGELKQIEVNNIASGMGPLCQRVSNWHKKAVKRYIQDLPEDHIFSSSTSKDHIYSNGVSGNHISNGISKNHIPLNGTLNNNLPSDDILEDHLPFNDAPEVVAEGLYQAWLSMENKNSAVLFVVEDLNQNQLDQRHTEYGLMEKDPSIRVFRLTLTQCSEFLSLKENDLVFDNKIVISLIYFRSGYSPKQYHSKKEWDARLMMEKSNAIKCPWIGLQLANTKKVQQVISKPGFVEKYFSEEPNSVIMIRKTFAGLWGLETQDEETKEIISHAIDHPEKYVLKPQLEGGGGNFYGEELSQKLKTMTNDELAAHILMERIHPMAVKNVLIRPLQPVSIDNVVSELGVFGHLLGDGEEVLECKSGGFLMRTKGEEVNEGGVSVGVAVIDSPFLF